MASEPILEKTILKTIIGPLAVSGDNDFIHKIEFAGRDAFHGKKHTPASAIVKDAVDQLNSYFSGTLFAFELPILLSGTDFQKSVWQVMQTIEYGQVITYGDIARRLGNIHLSRAVGQAANRNPVPIVIPCHRVVGVNGAMVGFAGGVAVKKLLLQHENHCSAKRK